MPNIRTNDALSALIIQKITRISGALCQDVGAEANIYVYILLYHKGKT